jgi:hypothetical protein
MDIKTKPQRIPYNIEGTVKLAGLGLTVPFNHFNIKTTTRLGAM